MSKKSAVDPATGDPQDAAKIHAEINQAVNQRFLLTAAAITTFGFFLLRAFPGKNSGVEIGMQNAVTCFVFVFVLFLLFEQSVRIRKMMRVYSTYLIARNLSQWESDWYSFRDLKIKDKTGHEIARYDTRSHGLVFIGIALCGCLVGSYYLCLLMIDKDAKEPTQVIAVLAFYANLWLAWIAWDKGNTPVVDEEEMLENWRGVLEKNDDEKNR